MAVVRPEGELVATWISGGLVLWGIHDGAPLRGEALRDLLATIDWARPVVEQRAVVDLPAGRTEVACRRLPPTEAFAFLSAPSRRWPPSLRWCAAVARLAALAAASGRAVPVLDREPLAWRGRWALVEDTEIDLAIERLADARPPACGAGSAGVPALAHTSEALAALTDAACRWALTSRGWRPPIGGSRRHGAVAVRRVVDGLTTNEPVTGASARQEEYLTQIAETLERVRDLVGGALDVELRLRLSVPDALDAPWVVELEVVPVDDPSLAVPASHVWAGDGDAALLGAAALPALRRRLRRVGLRVGAQVPELAALATATEPAVAHLDIESVATLLASRLPACERAGAPLVVPAGLVRVTPRVSGSLTPRPEPASSGGLAGAVVDVDWAVALGDDRLTEAELAALAAAKAGLVELRGRWVRVDPSSVRSVLDALARRQAAPSAISPLAAIAEVAAAAADGIEVNGGGWIADLLAGLPDDRLEEHDEPVTFSGTLRHYQRRALGWLGFLGRLGLGACLADDMGLGKTPTTLAHLEARRAASAPDTHRPHLVICPLSVVRTWEREAERFAPAMRVAVVHGPGRARDDALVELAGEHDLVVTTYATATRDVAGLAKVDWDVVVLDEAQAVKNHLTKAARAVRRLAARQKVALTGTPVENRLGELWAILDAVNPGMLGGPEWFAARFAVPIEQRADAEAVDALRRLTGPFVLRRTKADKRLVPELPDKVESVAWATLTREQASLYRAIVEQFTGELTEATGIGRKGLVLATLTRLKQVCNHPAHFLGDGSRLAGRSGKLAVLDELVAELLDAGERLLLFTQYRAMGDLLVTHLAERHGVHVPFLHGGVARARRDEMVDRFQSGAGSPIQLVSLKAGGTGLTLTAASRVIHYDRWWNPAVEDQATDRAWRIGQTQTVFVHKLVCQGTLEERIDALLLAKRELADLAVGTGEGWLTELSTEQLRDLVALDRSALEHP